MGAGGLERYLHVLIVATQECSENGGVGGYVLASGVTKTSSSFARDAIERLTAAMVLSTVPWGSSK